MANVRLQSKNGNRQYDTNAISDRLQLPITWPTRPILHLSSPLPPFLSQFLTSSSLPRSCLTCALPQFRLTSASLPHSCLTCGLPASLRAVIRHVIPTDGSSSTCRTSAVRGSQKERCCAMYVSTAGSSSPDVWGGQNRASSSDVAVTREFVQRSVHTI